MNYKKLIQHEKALKKEVFFVEKKWPHFDILFKDIKNISNTLKKNSVVVSIEETFSPLSIFRAPSIVNF